MSSEFYIKADPILSRFVSFFVTWNWVSFVHLWVEKTADKKIEMFLETLSKTFVFSWVTGYPPWLGFIINCFAPLLLSLVWIYHWRNWTTKLRFKRIK